MFHDNSLNCTFTFCALFWMFIIFKIYYLMGWGIQERLETYALRVFPQVQVRGAGNVLALAFLLPPDNRAGLGDMGMKSSWSNWLPSPLETGQAYMPHPSSPVWWWLSSWDPWEVLSPINQLLLWLVWGHCLLHGPIFLQGGWGLLSGGWDLFLGHSFPQFSGVPQLKQAPFPGRGL